MLKLNCFLRPDYSLRLTHDISPENLPDNPDDYESEIRKEKYILSCLTKRAPSPEVECTKDNGDEKQELSPLQIKQKTLEQLNNVINNQYHGVIRQGEKQHNSRDQHNIGEHHIVGEHHLVGDSEYTVKVDADLISNTQQKKTDIDNTTQEGDTLIIDELQKNSTIAKRPNTLSGCHVVKPVLTKGNRKHRRLPAVPAAQVHTSVVPNQALNTKPVNEKCLADELQEALLRVDTDEVFIDDQPPKRNKVYPKFSKQYLNDLKYVCFNSVSSNTAPCLSSDNVYLSEDSVPDTRPRPQSGHVPRNVRHLSTGSSRLSSSSDVDVEPLSNLDQTIQSQTPLQTKEQKQTIALKEEMSELSASAAVPLTSDDRRRRNSGDDLEVTHRGMHRFIPRHQDEIVIEIGDPIHVFRLDDDLWCEGVNLRTLRRGIFPSMYATDLNFLEESDTDEDGNSHFNMRFLGSVEVSGHKGDDVLCQAINKVALSRRSAKTSPPPPIVSVEISQYGIRMLDKSKLGHETDDHFTHFFALKNISFCGFHPRNERYFGFITKHPKSYRFACHVFLGEKSTRTVSDALGNAFKRFYQEYMAFTHPTEDIYME
nr:uncharacterized protein LOC105324754 isoform X2 [Crassostrea gigas]